MLHPGLDFHTVRVRCRDCGWFRNIAHSGCANGRRALVSIRVSEDLSHVLAAHVEEVAEELPLDDVLAAHPGYRDLVHEAHQIGLIKMLGTFDSLLAGRSCPRCRVSGSMTVDQILELGKHVRY